MEHMAHDLDDNDDTQFELERDKNTKRRCKLADNVLAKPASMRSLYKTHHLSVLLKYNWVFFLPPGAGETRLMVSFVDD